MAIEGENKGHMHVVLDTLGCKLNQAETESLAIALAGDGYKIISSDEEVDIYILNTCTVTHVADRKARHLLRLTARRNPRAVIIATGCYACRAAAEISKLGDVIVLPEKEEIRPFLNKLKKAEIAGEAAADFRGAGRNRTFISIHNGCDYRCAYCIVPLVRGRARSRPLGEIISEIRNRVSAGYKEAVLTGTEIGEYESGGINLPGLIARVLAETGVERLRLSSLQPGEITPGLLALWQDARLCPHFHISLQSGSDAILKRMRRRYTTQIYTQAVSLIRSSLPNAAITTDIIVGFPGETNAEFEESLAFCRDMGFARMHVFPFSSRPGTEAETMPGQVDEKTKRQRTERMLALAKESALAFRRQFLGWAMPVLWEQQSGGLWSGYTGNYIRVYCRSSEDLVDKITDVRLERVWWDGVKGMVI